MSNSTHKADISSSILLHPTATMFHRQYKPDYFLPEYRIYIAFYGIDQQVNTAPYIDREQYYADMKSWYKKMTKGQKIFVYLVFIALVFVFGIGLLSLAILIYLQLGGDSTVG